MSATFLAPFGRNGKSVYAGTAVAVLYFLALINDLGFIVRHCLTDVNGSHHLGSIHVGACDAVHIKDGHIEAVGLVVGLGAYAFANAIVLVFQTGVQTAVIGVQCHAAQVSGQSLYASQHTPLQVHLDESGGEGHINAIVLLVVSYALYMVSALRSAANLAWKA